MNIWNKRGKVITTSPGRTLKSARLSGQSLQNAVLSGYPPQGAIALAASVVFLPAAEWFARVHSLTMICSNWPIFGVVLLASMASQIYARAAVLLFIATNACLVAGTIISNLFHDPPTFAVAFGSVLAVFALNAPLYSTYRSWIIGGFDLSGSDLCHTDLSGARMDWADLEGAQIDGLLAKGASLMFARVADVSGTGADLSFSRLTSSSIVRTCLRCASLTKADLRYAHIADTDLSHSNLTEANPYRANLENVDLRGAMLVGAKMDKARLVNIQFDETTLWCEPMPAILTI